jgi:hypothetical protein
MRVAPPRPATLSRAAPPSSGACGGAAGPQASRQVAPFGSTQGSPVPRLPRPCSRADRRMGSDGPFDTPCPAPGSRLLATVLPTARCTGPGAVIGVVGHLGRIAELFNSAILARISHQLPPPVAPSRPRLRPPCGLSSTYPFGYASGRPRVRPCLGRECARWARRSARGPERSDRSLAHAPALVTASTAEPGEKRGLAPQRQIPQAPEMPSFRAELGNLSSSASWRREMPRQARHDLGMGI